MKGRDCTLVGLLLCLAVGCATTRADWESATRLRTTAAYQQFLDKHPTGEFADMARREIESLEFKQARDQDTIEAYQAFLSKYPKGNYSSSARSNIQAAEWREACRKNTVDGYQAFVSKYPSNDSVGEARLRIELLQRRSSKGSDWDVAVVAVTNEGRRFVPIKSLPATGIEAPVGRHLIRVTTRLEHLDATPIMGGFVTDATIGDAQGKRHKYVAAGPKGGLLFHAGLQGQQAMGFPASARAEIDYVFSIPDGVTVVDFTWGDFPAVPIAGGGSPE